MTNHTTTNDDPPPNDRTVYVVRVRLYVSARSLADAVLQVEARLQDGNRLVVDIDRLTVEHLIVH